jgi:hypothetical protein
VAFVDVPVVGVLDGVIVDEAGGVFCVDASVVALVIPVFV